MFARPQTTTPTQGTPAILPDPPAFGKCQFDFGLRVERILVKATPIVNQQLHSVR